MITHPKFWIAAVLLASLTTAAQADGIKTNTYGDAASNEAAERTISLTSATKWVNVTDGEIVRFSKDGRTFAWHFSTLNSAPFDLSAIAPAGVDVKGVRVHVAADPLLGGP
ncbi:MAG TPA: CzcE family metal-binding protein [Burkholderiaceae bacterium]